MPLPKQIAMKVNLTDAISQSTTITLGLMVLVVSAVFYAGMFTMRVLSHEPYMDTLRAMIERADIRIEQNERRIDVLERHVEWLEREQQRRDGQQD